MTKKNYAFACVAALIFIVLLVITLNTPCVADIENYTPAVYSSLISLLPPVIAIVLALITKEVYCFRRTPLRQRQPCINA